jgi:hypothetical protein
MRQEVNFDTGIRYDLNIRCSNYPSGQIFNSEQNVEDEEESLSDTCAISRITAQFDQFSAAGAGYLSLHLWP